MSEPSDNDMSLDLQFLPEWAQEDADKNKYAKHTGEDRQREGQKSSRRDRKNPRRDTAQQLGARSSRTKDSRSDSTKARDKRGQYDKKRGKINRPQAPQLELKVDFVPDIAGVESIAREIKLTGRAYPLFQIAHLVLERPTRYTIRLSVQKKSGGEISQRLYICKLDGSAWLSQEQVTHHALAEHFDDFYETNRVEVAGPKGNFTFVAQCGVTNEFLGAPNHHDYQNKLFAFHSERLPKMPFEKFKSRIRITKEEEAINAWLEQSKWKTEFVSLKTEERASFDRRDEVQVHFEANHQAEVAEEVESCTVSGEKAKSLREPRQLAEFLKDQWHKQKHFPMQLSTHLSRIFSSLGLQFFKKDKKVTHVSVARPSYLDIEAEPVSESVRRIMQFIDATNNCTRRQILDQLESVEEDETERREEASSSPDRSDKQNQIISDLHWLIHQGHVLEFSNGIIETAKKPRKKFEGPNENVEPEENPESGESQSSGVAC